MLIYNPTLNLFLTPVSAVGGIQRNELLTKTDVDEAPNLAQRTAAPLRLETLLELLPRRLI